MEMHPLCYLLFDVRIIYLSFIRIYGSDNIRFVLYDLPVLFIIQPIAEQSPTGVDSKALRSSALE